MSIYPARPFIYLMMCMALAACGQAGAGGANLTSKDAGSTIHVKQGSAISIALEGNPTTGYTWELARGSDGGLVEQQGDAEFKADTGALGSGGIVTLRFKAAQPGTANLQLIYHRPFESNVALLQSFGVTIVVD